MGFQWIGRAQSDERRSAEAALEMNRREVRQRATLLRHLGYKRSHVSHMLAENFKWEYELLGRPAVLDDVDRIVLEVYGRSES
ncbi:MAG: hypothetical protein HY791_19080 [Deltaproteobacteria bacterium]|nr:hypothetical protein [Deltaproteobacteria bacterium]